MSVKLLWRNKRSQASFSPKKTFTIQNLIKQTFLTDLLSLMKTFVPTLPHKESSNQTVEAFWLSPLKGSTGDPVAGKVLAPGLESVDRILKVQIYEAHHQRPWKLDDMRRFVSFGQRFCTEVHCCHGDHFLTLSSPLNRTSVSRTSLRWPRP